MDKNMIDILFTDDETGDSMFVELDKSKFKSTRVMIEYAQTKISDYMDTPVYCGLYSVEDAEELGYDTI